jgi:cobalt-zinc-cadmium efflux system outer membrane protein
VPPLTGSRCALLLLGSVIIAPIVAAGEPFSTATNPTGTATSISTLTLSEAINRTLKTHPDLQLFQTREASLQAAAESAAQRPAIALGLDAENFGGTGATTAADSAEITLSLASVLERGGKREARQAFAATQLDAMSMAREATRLDLMAEVARRYLDVVRAQAQEHLRAEDVAQRVRTVAAAARRVQAGASPESTRLTAEAAQARAELERARAEREIVAAYRRLALLWGDRRSAAQPMVGDLMELPAIPDFDALSTLIERTPEFERFATESRLREARLQLARSERAPDLSWKLGVRRLQDVGSWAVVAGVSVPLGSPSRAQPQIHSAQAELDAVAVERQSSELSLFATLAEAHGRYVTARAEVEQTRDEVLPRLERAQAATERAYRAGAVSYLEWAQVQSEIVDVREQQLAAAHDAQRALIEIQRLTGEPFVQPNPAGQGPTP